MSLRFYFGSSGAGKSYALHQEILKRSAEQPDKEFLILVPDQFTMQTQKEIVLHHPDGVIRNIDVLSFGRLSHRIFEEVGYDTRPVLDDTGKSLVLRKLAGSLQEKLPVLGGNLSRQSYIHEVKSAISEFMQYGVGQQELGQLIDYAKKRGALQGKLQDLKTIYQAFQDYIKERYLTTEETLDLLRNRLHRSAIIRRSVVILDGFTGFTPIQYHLIRELMRLAQEVIVTVTLPEEEDPFETGGEQQLFYLSKKTVKDLVRIAEEEQIQRGEDVYLKGAPRRFAEKSQLAHLEKHLFRYPLKPYLSQTQKKGQQNAEPQTGQQGAEPQIGQQGEEPQNEQQGVEPQAASESGSIRMFEATDPKEEVRQAALCIRRMIRTRGYQYREIAVVCGNIGDYADYVEELFDQFEIPCFLDRTSGILLNPFIEYIRSALSIFVQDFSYESVFHYLRSGLSDFTREETDILENYILRFAIRGKAAYTKAFTKVSKELDTEEGFQQLNQLRQRLVESLQPLGGKKAFARAYVEGLYEFLIQSRIQQKLAVYEEKFEEEGEPSKAREYAQIYPRVMDLLDQILELLGEEELTLKEFADILDAGFGEIQVGTIPQNVDRVVVGDMERTRLKQVRALLFLGVNEGNIPKGTSKGGIISDIDREFLRESGMELAPSPRQQMYIQRLYLYLNMTKPSEQLILSFARVNGEGKQLRPSYLIEVMRKLFPELVIECPQLLPEEEQLETPAEGLRLLASGLRGYASGYEEAHQKQLTFTLFSAYKQLPEYEKRAQKLVEAAFYRYRHHPLARKLARQLYGVLLQNSVTRLETYAACAYRHFLQYGLSLQEREEYTFETVDMGNVFHGVLESFSGKLAEHQADWFSFTKEQGEALVEEALQDYSAVYGDTVLYSNARNTYMVERMKRILKRTVFTLQEQLKKGSFTPAGYEMSFQVQENLEAINIALSEEEKLRIIGRIDRVDVLERGDQVYVKIIDYKSGNRKFDIAAMYYGLQLQLVVYMNAAMELTQKNHPDKDVIPAAMLYYHVSDPTIAAEQVMTPEEVNEKLLSQLRMTGIVNDDMDVITNLDTTITDNPDGLSEVIPVEFKKDGSVSARSSVVSKEELKLMSGYVHGLIHKMGRQILDGEITLNPYVRGTSDSCTYCAYQAVCGFDKQIEGCRVRKLKNLSREEVLLALQQDLAEKGEA